MEVNDQLHSLATLPWKKPWYPLVRALNGSQGWSGYDGRRKITSPF